MPDGCCLLQGMWVLEETACGRGRFVVGWPGQTSEWRCPTGVPRIEVLIVWWWGGVILGFRN